MVSVQLGTKLDPKHNHNMDTYEIPAKDANDIFERMTCLGMLVILQYQEVNWPGRTGAEKKELAEIYHAVARTLREEWQDTLTPFERVVVDKPIGSWTSADNLNVGWRMECIAVMGWAIQLRDALPPFDCMFAELEFLESFNTRVKRDSLKRNIRLRAPSELDDFLSEAERWHWCARQAEGFFNASEFPTERQRQALRRAVGENVFLFGKPYHELNFEEFSTARSIAIERHRAINWIWDGEPWDEVSTDT